MLTCLEPHQTGVYQLGDLMSKSASVMTPVALEEQFKRHDYEIYPTSKYYHAKESHWLISTANETMISHL